MNKLKTNRKRDKDSYLKIIESARVNYEKKHHLVVPKNASTRPTFASMDETLYRVMYVYFDESVREEVSQLGHQLTRAKLDTRSSNNDVYSKLLALYNNEDAVTDYPLEVCDEITIAEQVQSILKYIIHHYKKARTNKNISGQHDHISSYCNGKDWIVIFDDLLKESDDPILSSYCGGELPKDCFFSSLEKKDTDNKKVKRSKTPTNQYKDASLKEDVRKSEAIENIARSMAGHTAAMQEMNEVRKAFMESKKSSEQITELGELQNKAFETKMEMIQAKKGLKRLDESDDDYDDMKTMFEFKIASLNERAIIYDKRLKDLINELK